MPKEFNKTPRLSCPAGRKEGGGSSCWATGCTPKFPSFFASSPAADGSLAILLMCWLFPSFFASSPAADGSLAYYVDLAGRNVCTFLLLLITWSASPPREFRIGIRSSKVGKNDLSLQSRIWAVQFVSNRESDKLQCHRPITWEFTQFGGVHMGPGRSSVCGECIRSISHSHRRPCLDRKIYPKTCHIKCLDTYMKY